MSATDFPITPTIPADASNDSVTNNDIIAIPPPDLTRAAPAYRSNYIRQQIIRIVQEWPTRYCTQQPAVQPRVREIADILQAEGIPTPRGGTGWYEQKLHQYMHYQGISINELLPDVPAWSNTASDRQRMWEAEVELGVPEHNRNFRSKAKDKTRCTKLIKIELTARLINRFFEVNRPSVPVTVDPETGKTNSTPQPQQDYYDAFPWDEVIGFLNFMGDTSPGGRRWNRKAVERFFEKLHVHPSASCRERYNYNRETLRTTGAIDPKKDCVIREDELQRCLEDQGKRMLGKRDYSMMPDQEIDPISGRTLGIDPMEELRKMIQHPEITDRHRMNVLTGQFELTEGE